MDVRPGLPLWDPGEVCTGHGLTSQERLSSIPALPPLPVGLGTLLLLGLRSALQPTTHGCVMSMGD